jgi:hypothetical protein
MADQNAQLRRNPSNFNDNLRNGWFQPADDRAIHREGAVQDLRT